jgi:hypothetical protein
VKILRIGILLKFRLFPNGEVRFGHCLEAVDPYNFTRSASSITDILQSMGYVAFIN